MSLELKNYRDLKVWQKARALVSDIYAASAVFPSDERFGLTQQIRRAAVSIPSNIAEGNGRKGVGEYAHFISIAYGSLCELETQLFIALDLEYLTQETLNALTEQTSEVGRMLNGLSQSLKQKRAEPEILTSNP